MLTKNKEKYYQKYFFWIKKRKHKDKVSYSQSLVKIKY